MRGRFAVGRSLVDQARQSYEELGQKLGLAANALWAAGEIALLSQEFGEAERFFHESCQILDEIGERVHLPTIASELGLPGGVEADGPADCTVVITKLPSTSW